MDWKNMTPEELQAHIHSQQLKMKTGMKKMEKQTNNKQKKVNKSNFIKSWK
jgi:hypothetical protein